MKKIPVLAALAAIITLTGCRSSEQVYDKLYLRGAAITGKSEKTAVFTFYDEENKSFSGWGDDLDEICRNAELSTGKSIFTGHTELIVLGDCDFSETLEFLLTQWKISPSCLVVYGGVNAAQVMKSNDTETLADSVKRAVQQGKAPECDVITVLSGLTGDSGKAEVPRIGSNGFQGTKEMHR